MQQLEGRAAVVTGAASGIGLAITEAFVAEGMRVTMADVDDESLQSHAARLTDGGAEVQAVVTDVRRSGRGRAARPGRRRPVR